MTDPSKFNFNFEEGSEPNNPTDSSTPANQVPTKVFRHAAANDDDVEQVEKPSEPRAEPSQSQPNDERGQDDPKPPNELSEQAAEPSKDSGGTSSQALNLAPPSSESSPDKTWSFEQIAETRPDVPRFAPCSEQTLQQAELIKQLVEEQQKETKERLEMQSKEGSLPVAKTAFVKEIEEIWEVIRKAHEEERQEEEKAKQIEDKSDKSDK